MTLDPPQSSGEALQNSSSQNLIREVKNWRDWTYTDGSLQKNVVGQGTGSGVYHLNVFQYVNLKGVGITNTISHAELAAAVIHGYSHTATDSLTSLHQFKKQLSHHIQGGVLQSIAKAICQSPSPIHFFKVSSAGIIGNEHADDQTSKPAERRKGTAQRPLQQSPRSLRYSPHHPFGCGCVGGTIYNTHTLMPFKELGLDF